MWQIYKYRLEVRSCDLKWLWLFRSCDKRTKWHQRSCHSCMEWKSQIKLLNADMWIDKHYFTNARNNINNGIHFYTILPWKHLTYITIPFIHINNNLTTSITNKTSSNENLWNMQLSFYDSYWVVSSLGYELSPLSNILWTGISLFQISVCECWQDTTNGAYALNYFLLYRCK